jgi:hypothetical protein
METSASASESHHVAWRYLRDSRLSLVALLTGSVLGSLSCQADEPALVVVTLSAPVGMPISGVTKVEVLVEQQGGLARNDRLEFDSAAAFEVSSVQTKTLALSVASSWGRVEIRADAMDARQVVLAHGRALVAVVPVAGARQGVTVVLRPTIAAFNVEGGSPITSGDASVDASP